MSEKYVRDNIVNIPPKYMYVPLTYHFPAKKKIFFKYFQLGMVAHADNPTTWGQEDGYKFEASLCYAVSTLSLNNIFR